MTLNKPFIVAEKRSLAMGWNHISTGSMNGDPIERTYYDPLGISTTVYATGSFKVTYCVPNSSNILESLVHKDFISSDSFFKVYNSIKELVVRIQEDTHKVEVQAPCLEEATESVRMNHIIYIVNVIFKTTDFCNERGHNPFKDVDLKELNNKSTEYILELSQLAEEVYESYTMGESYKAIINDIDNLSEKEFNQKYEIRSRKNS